MVRLRYASSALSLLSMMVSLSAFAGSAVIGNGGQTIDCAVGPNSTEEYALDYVVEAVDREDHVAPVQSIEQSLERIANLIHIHRRAFPELISMFESFRADIFNRTDESRYNFWVPARGALSLSDDQDLLHALPYDCIRNGGPMLRQAFWRVAGTRYTGQGTETTVYHYDPEILGRLRARPVQLSFLLVHEWLWNVSSNVQLNRRINFFLHSKEFATMTDAAVRKTLEDMGLDFARIGLLPGENAILSCSYNTVSGVGVGPAQACLDARRDYAVQKQQVFERFCKTDVPTNRIATHSYNEVFTKLMDGKLRCHVEWTFVCLASP